MSPYRRSDYQPVVPYRPKDPLWLTMVISTIVVLVCLGLMVAAPYLCLRAMGAL